MEVPKEAKLISLIWSFKRKRNSFGGYIKHKARLCVHDGIQWESINYWHMYAPVVNWSTVQLILILTQLTGGIPDKLIMCLHFHKHQLIWMFSVIFQQAFTYLVEINLPNVFYSYKRNCTALNKQLQSGFICWKNIWKVRIFTE